MVERRRIGSNPSKPRQFAYKAKPGQQAVNSLKPLKLKLLGDHPLHLDELLVFTDDNDTTVLSFIGPRGTLNVRLGLKSVAGLACALTKQLGVAKCG